MLRDQEFDLVFACAALHHTMKYPGALEELARVLRPGGRLVLCETWGGNPLLNGVRRLRSRFAGEAQEQGEDIILSWKELRALAPWFEGTRVETHHLMGMGKRLLRGQFQCSWARGVAETLEMVDLVLLAVLPALRNWCGEAVIVSRRAG